MRNVSPTTRAAERFSQIGAFPGVDSRIDDVARRDCCKLAGLLLYGIARFITLDFLQDGAFTFSATRLPARSCQPDFIPANNKGHSIWTRRLRITHCDRQ